MKIALLGHMGRDDALFERLQDHELHFIGQWQNPGLYEKIGSDEKRFHLVNSVTDTSTVANIVESVQPNMFISNSDDALAAGVVDALRMKIIERKLRRDILIPSPDRKAAQIEWDNLSLHDIIKEIAPEYNPDGFMIKSDEDNSNEKINKAIHHFKERGMLLAVKPRNLSGGKGVRVMGKHFNNSEDPYEEARQYANQVIISVNQSGVEIQEKIEGLEFNFQIFTDGKTVIRPPVTYDFPYREDGDIGPGTGGMGAFSMEDGLLPFVTQEDYDEIMDLMEKILEWLSDHDIDYKGVLYPTFFKTPEGKLKIVEINARGGDPELINMMDLMEDDVDMAEVLTQISKGQLKEDSIKYKKLASAMVYLVSPDYGYSKADSYNFSVDPKVIESYECKLRFAAAIRQPHVLQNYFQTVGSSRTVGVSALGATPWEARRKILEAIKAGFGEDLPLQFRKEIAQKEYIESLRA